MIVMPSGHKLAELIERFSLGNDLIKQVWAVIPGGEYGCRAEAELRNNIAPGRLIGGRCQRDQRHPRKALLQDRELLVFGTEIVAPLRDAVRFVNREQGQRRPLEQIETARRH